MQIAGEEEEKANDRFRKLITLHTRTALLSDIYATAGYSHGRATQTLLQSFLGRNPNPLAELGALHRTCVWENIVLKAALTERGIDTTPSSHDLFSSLLSAAGAQDLQSTTPAGDAAGATTSAATNGATPGESSTITPPTVVTKKEEQPRDKNAKCIKHLVVQIPSSLAPFFQCELRPVFVTSSSFGSNIWLSFLSACSAVPDS